MKDEVSDPPIVDDTADLGQDATLLPDLRYVRNGRNGREAEVGPDKVTRVVSSRKVPDAAGPHDDIHTALIDASGLSLADLDGVGQSALAAALRRTLDPDGQSLDPVVGFQSGI
jgi:FXSXX-COOH protein